MFLFVAAGLVLLALPLLVLLVWSAAREAHLRQELRRKALSPPHALLDQQDSE